MMKKFNQSASKQEEENQKDSQEVCLNEIRNQIFDVSYLFDQLNAWANKNHFHFNKTEGIKQNKEGYYRSFVCNEKKCKFRLTFRSDKTGKHYKLDEILADKNSKHSKK